MIKAVILDMDGVMFDTERLAVTGWKEAGRILGFSMTESQLNQIRGSITSYSRILFQNWFGTSIDYDEARRLRSQYVDSYIAAHSIPLKEGLEELLKYLKACQIPAVVATCSRRHIAERYWKEAGISSLITESICGDEVEKGKPDPEIFLKAARKIQMPIENCLIVEDSFNGIRAARASGAIVCMIPDLMEPTEEIRSLCNYILKDLRQIIEKLERQQEE